jgi:Zn ribbon nucleic-acid-binding protein
MSWRYPNREWFAGRGTAYACPSCGGGDVSTWGDAPTRGSLNTDEHNRTDADLVDCAECGDCGWTARRPMEESEDEALRTRSGPQADYVLAFRHDRLMSEALERSGL